MKIAVVIPSRLQKDARGHHYIYQALESVDASCSKALTRCHIIIALDPGQEFANKMPNTTVLNAPEANQASAVNAGMGAAVASGANLIASIEDDDLHKPDHLRAALWAVEHLGADFVSSSSDLFADDGVTQVQGHVATSGTFDFPIASTWVMRPEVWKAAGPYNPEYRTHPDNEWLCRLNALNRFRRVHLIEQGLHPPARFWNDPRAAVPWLQGVARFSWVVPSPFGLTVRRRVQAGSVLARTTGERSSFEYSRMLAKYGTIGW